MQFHLVYFTFNHRCLGGSFATSLVLLTGMIEHSLEYPVDYPIQNKALGSLLMTIGHLRGVSSLLSWDQEVMLPRGAVEARAAQSGVVSAQIHTLHTSDAFREALALDLDLATGQLLRECSALEATALRLIYTDWKKAMCLPISFVSEYACLVSHSQHCWQEARAKNDFSLFAPMLEKVIEKSKEKARLLGFIDQPYDGLLDEFEPGMTSAEITPLFARIREGLRPLLATVLETQKAPLTFGDMAFDCESQLQLCRDLLGTMTFDYAKGRLDLSTHPFTTHFHPSDVRLTIRLNPSSVAEGISGTLHEGGHALYEQGLPAHCFGTPLGEATSLGVHESQSRIWENNIGLSRPFWKGFYPKVQTLFSDALRNVSVDDFYASITHVKPSLIRVDADELTYHMHIFIRYELEQLVFRDGIPVSELPMHWNRLYQDYLGITPDTDAMGILQDVHWSCGLFGYFPTYTLGTIIAVQLFNQAMKDIPTLEEDITRGRFDAFSRWLTASVHRHGRGKTATQLVQDICGCPINDSDFLRYLTVKYSGI